MHLCFVFKAGSFKFFSISHMCMRHDLWIKFLFTLVDHIEHICNTFEANVSPYVFITTKGSFQDVWKMRTFILIWRRAGD